MFVTMEAQAYCPCGQAVRVIMTGTARINKRSMRITGPLLGALEHSSCPACARPLRDGEPLERSAYRLDAGSEAEVIAYRRRKWGLEDAGTGPLVEAPEKHQRGEKTA